MGMLVERATLAVSSMFSGGTGSSKLSGSNFSSRKLRLQRIHLIKNDRAKRYNQSAIQNPKSKIAPITCYPSGYPKSQGCIKKPGSPIPAFIYTANALSPNLPLEGIL
jgi:hypothetical protein